MTALLSAVALALELASVALIYRAAAPTPCGLRHTYRRLAGAALVAVIGAGAGVCGAFVEGGSL